MEKTFVLDTNVILFDPQSIFKFGKNRVHIPLVVIEETDRFKREQSENGRNARHFSRLVDDLRKKGPLVEGVPLENGGKLILSVDRPAKTQHDFLDLKKTDNLILSTALALREGGEEAILITKDTNLRLKADILGISAEDYGQKRVSLDEVYSGQGLLEVEDGLLKRYQENKILSLDEGALKEKAKSFFPNQYILLKNPANEEGKIWGRYCRKREAIIPLTPLKEGVWGIHPRNIEQHFAFDALLNEDIKLVTLLGTAGTGKTLLAIAAGLEMAVSQECYHRLLISRPIWPMGKDLGYLPGDLDEKLTPWMRPIFDNMDFLFGQGQAGDSVASYNELINHGLLQIEPLSYIRGRSIPGQYFIVDEAQNLSPQEVKAIITRAGEGAKIILAGDCHQIDNPYLDEVNNGLIHTIDCLKKENIVAHVVLKTGERSLLSEVASQHL